jgi:ATP-binding cassette subfamily D (ALD) long-chain fatty acid import protein
MFLRGSQTEKNLIERGYFALLKHINRILRMRMVYSSPSRRCSSAA